MEEVGYSENEKNTRLSSRLNDSSAIIKSDEASPVYVFTSGSAISPSRIGDGRRPSSVSSRVVKLS